ncbi:hypothetical protein VTL71DRAFT_13661 [Oculimacula yallundae]|uniref:BTB domain-containing protein n=1 Tax=Oculimacula yallundae TaxID=86028 RepID=A0ABR4CL29_9HELO
MPKRNGAAIDERPHKKAKLIGGFNETITLKVGIEPETKAFSVHKAVLCEVSSFFKAACNPTWMKNEDKVIRLPDDNPEAIQAMIYWMYQDKLGITDDEYEAPTRSGEALDTFWGLLVKIYIVGDKYDLPGLRNQVIDTLIYEMENVGDEFPMGIIPYIYEHTIGPENPLRKLTIASMKRYLSSRTLLANKEILCPGFLYELTFALVKDCEYRDEDEDNLSIDFCERFHSHADPNKICVKLRARDIVENVKD